MKKFIFNIRAEVKIGVALIGIFLLIAFSERKQSGAVCKNIVVELENTNENHFIEEADVMKIIENTGITVIGKSIDQINLRSLESKLESNNHILNAEIFGDVKGNLTVNVKLRRAVARLVRSNGPDAYVAEDGKIMATSSKFSSRIILVSGAIVDELIEKGDLLVSEQGHQLMDMIKFVNADPFWKAQIAQLDFNKSGKVFIY
ncbi:MAG: hypothetical protein RIF46_13825, partial [Cyclobacteriaceae bacterium]